MLVAPVGSYRVDPFYRVRTRGPSQEEKDGESEYQSPREHATRGQDSPQGDMPMGAALRLPRAAGPERSVSHHGGGASAATPEDRIPLKATCRWARPSGRHHDGAQQRRERAAKTKKRRKEEPWSVPPEDRRHAVVDTVLRSPQRAPETAPASGQSPRVGAVRHHDGAER